MSKTRSSLLAATVAEILERGEAGVRIESILAAAGSSFSSLYHHFGNREGLIVAAEISLLTGPISRDFEMFADMAKAVTNRDELVSWLKAGIAQTHSSTNSDERALQLSIYNSAATKPALAAALAETSAQVTDVLASMFADLRSRDLFSSAYSDRVIAQYIRVLVLGQIVIERDETPTSLDQWHAVVFTTLCSLLEIE